MTTYNNLGPLTTVFTPPAACTQLVLVPSNLNFPQATLFEAQGCNQGDLEDAALCWPPATVSAPSPPLDGWGFYSPGLSCPSGYATACSAARNVGRSQTGFDFQFPLDEGESAAGCCPSGFTCSPINSCYLLVSTGILPVASCDGDDVQTLTTDMAISSIWSLESTSGYIAMARLGANMLQIKWREADRAPIASPNSTPAAVSAEPTAPISVTTQKLSVASTSSNRLFSSMSPLPTSSSVSSTPPTPSSASSMTTEPSSSAPINGIAPSPSLKIPASPTPSVFVTTISGSLVVSTVVASPTTDPSPLPSSPSTSLSQNTRIGIGAGTVVLALLLISSLLFYLRRLRRQERDSTYRPYTKTWLSSTGIKRRSPARELAANISKTELPTSTSSRGQTTMARELHSHTLQELWALEPLELPGREKWARKRPLD